MSTLDLSIVIVNYNGAAFIKECLDSIYKSQCAISFEVIVVDNESSDESVSIIKHYEKPIVLIENKHNYGFSYANNQAFEIANGHTLFMLNNDTILKPDTLQKLMAFLTNRPKIGAVAPKLLNEDGSIQCPGSSLGHWRFKSTSPKKVPFIAGAAVLIRKEVMDLIGGLDPHLFFYNDDIDFCYNLKKNGFEIWYYPVAELVHFGGLSTKFRKVGSLIEGYRGGLYIAKKHYGNSVYILYRFILLLDIVPRLIFHFIFSAFNKQSEEYVQAYISVLMINIRGDYKPKYPSR